MYKKKNFLINLNKLNIRTERIDKILSKSLKYSRSQIKKWMLNKKVKINGKIVNKPSKRFPKNKMFVEILLKISNFIKPQNIPLNIIYEDDEITVINKQSNLVVHPGAGNDNNTLLNSIIYHYPKNILLPRGGIVHRLDKNTTGLMIIAKTVFSYNKLKEDFKLQKIKKEYEAIVYGVTKKNGKIDIPISRDKIKRISMSVNLTGKKSITLYKAIEYFNLYTRLKIIPKSGRTHQIRVHMAYIKHFILGDPIYKQKKNICLNDSKKIRNFIKKFNRQALHSKKLTLIPPGNNREIKLCAEVPNDMKKLINLLRLDKLKNN